MLRAIRKHLFLLVGGGLALALALLTGVVSARYAADPAFTAFLESLDGGYLFLWRVVLYTFVVALWPWWTERLLRARGHSVKRESTSNSGRDRKTVLLVCLIFELLVAQNAAGRLLGWLMGASG